jgi:hypothetical protein
MAFHQQTNMNRKNQSVHKIFCYALLGLFALCFSFLCYEPQGQFHLPPKKGITVVVAMAKSCLVEAESTEKQR